MKIYTGIPMRVVGANFKIERKKKTKEEEVQPANEIWYTTTDGNIITPYTSDSYDYYNSPDDIISNVYENGKGVITLADDVTELGVSFIRNTTTLYTLSIPSNITVISNYTAAQSFAYNTSLISVKLPNTITTLGYGCFTGCNNLSSINSEENSGIANIPECVTDMSFFSFSDTDKLTTYNLPSTLTYIGQGSWKNDSSITINYNGTILMWNSISKAINYCGASLTFTIHCTDGDTTFTTNASCFLKGTKITLLDNSTKNIEDITYNDDILVWNADEGKLDSAKPVWLTQSGLMNDHYYKITFSDGTILKVTGVNSNHKMYFVDRQEFYGCAYAKEGDRIYSQNGIVTVVSNEYIEEEVEYYNIQTDQHINCFAEGILTSDRYGNLYPHDENMMYVKDDREIRPYSEFEAVGISKYWYDHLRMGESTEELDKAKDYIQKCESQMLDLDRTKE